MLEILRCVAFSCCTLELHGLNSWAEVNAMRTLNDLIATYEKRLATLRKLNEIIGEDEGLAQELLSAMGSAASGGGFVANRGVGDKRTSAGSPQLVRVIGFFKASGNAWQKVSEIVAGTALKRTSLAPLLHRNKGTVFEHRKHPSIPRLVQWRLRPTEPAQPDTSDNGVSQGEEKKHER